MSERRDKRMTLRGRERQFATSPCHRTWAFSVEENIGLQALHGHQAELRFFSRSCSCLTCPYVAPHTAKIHTLITLGIRVRTDPHVSRPGTAFPLGSIPIARSTLKQCQATQGDSIRVNTLIRWEGLGNRRWGATVSWPHVS